MLWWWLSAQFLSFFLTLLAHADSPVSICFGGPRESGRAGGLCVDDPTVMRLWKDTDSLAGEAGSRPGTFKNGVWARTHHVEMSQPVLNRLVDNRSEIWHRSKSKAAGKKTGRARPWISYSHDELRHTFSYKQIVGVLLDRHTTVAEEPRYDEHDQSYFFDGSFLKFVIPATFAPDNDSASCQHGYVVLLFRFNPKGPGYWRLVHCCFHNETLEEILGKGEPWEHRLVRATASTKFGPLKFHDIEPLENH